MIAAASIGQIGQLAQNFNWHQPSWDLFILGGWALGTIIYAFTAGRGRVINILMSVYIAKLLVHEAPFLNHVITKNLPSSLLALQQLATFVIVFLILFMLLGRYAFRTSADGRQLGSMVFGFVFSFLQIGLLINTILSYLPSATQESFAPLIQLVFVKDPASFIWLVAPLVFLIVLGKFVADPNEM
jgi:hypothetical protein